MASSKGNDDEFTPRDYQVELYHKSKDANRIIWLPTGAGKTFIAVMLIKHLQHQLRDFGPNTIGKRTVFLAPVIPLVLQQRNEIERHTHLDVGAFYEREWEGLDQDEETKKRLFEEIKKYQVLVMTPEIFHQIVVHGVMKLSQCNLIIFDEVHKAVKNHPYREAMRDYEKCSDKPRILGMSACLINKKLDPNKANELRNQVTKLEQTMSSICITSEKSSDDYAANPNEVICFYCQNSKSSDLVDSGIMVEISKAFEVIKNKIMFLEKCDTNNESEFDDKTQKKLKKYLKDTLLMVNVFGLWCAQEMADLFIGELDSELESLESNPIQDPLLSSIISAVRTALFVFNCSIKKHMDKFNSKYQLLKFAKPKLLCLLHLLYEYNLQNDGLCCLVFAEQRAFCLILSKWLAKIASLDANYEFLRVNFVVGSSNSDYVADFKHQEETLLKFRNHKYNVLVATSVLEEGIDVPRCNLVIRFDFPKTFGVYVQSKGRARDRRRGNYVVILDKDDASDQLKDLHNFKETELALGEYCRRKVVIKRENVHFGEDDDLLPPYKPDTRDGAPKVTMNSAIQDFNRYCSKLPTDKFTKSLAQFDIKGTDNAYFCVLRLPSNSPARATIGNEITGVVRKRKKNAKKAAALKTCELLHKEKELDDNFLPIGMDSNKLKKIFKELGLEYGPSEIKTAGTKKRRQLYLKRTADVLINSAPKFGTDYYLYVFKMNLRCPMPDEFNKRGKKIIDPAKTNRSFGILTTQKLPAICDFPLYTRAGEIVVSIKLVQSAIRLSQKQIDKLIHFHRFTFQEILRLVKPSEFDLENSNSKHFVVPTLINILGNANVTGSIDWNFVDLIYNQKELSFQPPDEKQQKNFVFKREDYLDAVVVAWYRKEGLHFFYVEEICDDLNPKSPFPNPAYKSFESYFESNYQVKIFNPKQPLVDTDYVPKSFNFLTPAFISRKGDILPTVEEKTKEERRKKRDHQVHLVPELCHVLPFPASIWRKAVCLPSILFRLNSLFVAEQFRYHIAVGCGLRMTQSNFVWPELNFGWTFAEFLARAKQDKSKSKTVQEISPGVEKRKLSLTDVEVDQKDCKTVATGVIKIGVNAKTNKKAKESLETTEKAIDFTSKKTHKLVGGFSGYWLTPTYLEKESKIIKTYFTQKLFVYDDFFKCLNLNETKVEDSKKTTISLFDNFYKRMKIDEIDRCESMSIDKNKIVKVKQAQSEIENWKDKLWIKFDAVETNNNIGPSPSLILQALTMSSAADGFNLERLETIGDSFLKYAATVFLFVAYPEIHEGHLSLVKCRLISNRNLYHLGAKFKIGEMMNGLKFEPKGNWCPPNFLISANNSMQQSETAKDVDEQFSYDKHKYQLISDKSIADSIEALIGAYLLLSGPRGAISFMKWLGLKVTIPNHDFQHFKGPIWRWLPLPKPPLLTPIGSSDKNNRFQLNQCYEHWGFKKFEEKIGYSFNDKAYLVQALTHNSFYENSLTDCYQRLEFLGDAVLDYLITRYLYETQTKLTPGALTDLRSALVNNIFFASMSVKFGFHKFLKLMSPDLFKVIGLVVAKFEENDQIDDWYFTAEGESSSVISLEHPSSVAFDIEEDIEVPKALGDIFESVAGAIYLDSQMSLDRVWEVYVKMLGQKIDYYSKSVPKSPIRILMEKVPGTKFGKPEFIDENEETAKVIVSVKGVGTFEGLGRNKKFAKISAAKRALRHLRSDK